MANGDLLGNLLLSLAQNGDMSQSTDDNTLIQKMVAPNDYVQLQDNAPVFTQSDPSAFKWGGLQFLSAIFSRNSVAYNLDGSYAGYNPRFPNAKYGQGILIEEGTTNLLTYLSYVNSGNLGTFEYLNQVNPLGGNSVMHLKGTTSGWAAQNIVINQGTYTVSAYIKLIQGNTLSLTIVGTVFYTDGSYDDYTWAGTGYTITSMPSLGTNVYKLVAPSFATSSNKTINYFQSRITCTSSSSFEIMVYGIQLEQESYPTSFINGTRQAESLTIPATGVFNKGNWTIEAIYMPTNAYTPTHWYMLCEIYIDANNMYQMGVSAATGELTARLWSNGTLYTISMSTPITAGNIYCCGMSGNGNTLTFVVNGVLIGTLAYLEPLGNLPLNIAIGSGGGTTPGTAHWCNGIIDDLRISNIARTAASMISGYNSNQPLPVDQYTTCKLNFDGNLLNTAYYNPGWIWGAGQYQGNPMVKNGLILYLSGKDFQNSPPTTILRDRSGMGNNATANNFAYTTSSGSDGQGGVVFDGINDNLTVNQALLGTTPFSIEISFTTPSTLSGQYYTLLSKCINASSGTVFDIDILSGNLRMFGYNTSLTTFGNTTGIPLQSNTKYYATFVFDGSNFIIYINGVQGSITAGISSAVFQSTTNPIQIGSRYNTFFLKGSIELVRIYNRALSQQEILENYNTSM